MAYKQITSCLGGAPFNADFGSIPGINNGDVLYLTFTNPLIDGCYSIDADAFTSTETVNTASLGYVDCATCLASCNNCEYWSFSISALDTGASYNGTVYADYFPCAGLGAVDAIYTFPGAGSYPDAVCVYSFSIPTDEPYIYYYASSPEITKIPALNSSTTKGVFCCGFTPTPTPTTTPTPTPPNITPSNTPTPNVTPTQTQTQTQTQTPTTTALYVEYGITSFGYATTNDACDSLNSTIPVYAEPGNTVPIALMVFYDDTNLTVPHNGGFLGEYYLLERLGTKWAAQVNTVGELTDYVICSALSTPTPTPDPTQTPSQTQTQTPSQTETQTQTPTPDPTQTPSQTQTQTQTPTPSVTIGLTPTQTETPTQTQTPTNTQTSTQTPTNTQTSTQTQTPTQTSTQTQTPTQTSTQTQTPTKTSTQTPTPTTTAGYTVQFADCTDNTNIFRFYNVNTVLSLGAVYLIDDSSMYSGCATVITSDGSGPLYDGSGVIFTQTASGCADPVCPRVSNRPALLYKCSNSTIFYANVEEDTAFVGAAYLYNGECYSFVEFSGPGGPNVGDPDYEDCNSCVPTPTPTSTPQSTPTNTPTVSITPLACTYTDFCFYTYLPSLSGYSGNYTLAGTYNTKNYYSGDGTTAGVIYYNTGVTENYWCLSNTLGGTCVLQGATPCYSECPDIAANDFYSGVCPTPTPTQINCSTFDFNAYFDCDWEPLPTPTPSVACDDVNFTVDTIGVTPTPTPTGDICNGVGISFSMSGYTPAVTPTITLTPSVTLTNTVPVGGQVTFPMVEETFSCVSVKVLTDCQSGDEYYVTDGLSFSGVPVVIGMTILVELNGGYHCVSYTRDDSNFSSNTVVGDIIQLYSVCEYCSIIPTPTPTVTTTPTVTPSSSPTPTPSITASPSVTPSQTATVGTTPPPTPNQTNTQTPTNTTTPTLTPTPSTTPNYVYVYESCSPIFPNLLVTQMIQTERVTFVPQTGVMFKDSLNTCWNYIGRFDSTYIAPSTVLPVTYSGNYFDGSPSIIYTTCVSCEEIPAIVGLCEQYQYWSGTRCDNGQTIIVKSCYSTPTQFTINTFEFGFAGTTNNTLDFNVKLGDIAIGNDGTDDFCVTINSELGAQNTNYVVSKPIGFDITSCTTCPVYKAYYANACDGSEQNVTLYYLTSESPFEANGGNIVSVSTTSTCYTVVSYIGLVSNPYISSNNAKFIIQGYADCQVCADAYYAGGGGGGGGGGSS